MSQNSSDTTHHRSTIENCLIHTDPQWRLRSAIYNNDFNTFKKLISSATVDLEYFYQFPDYKTCLELTICEVNKKEEIAYSCVTLLLQYEVKVNRINEKHDAAPIHFAVEFNNIGALEALLKDHRIDIDIKSKGNTALLLAIKKIKALREDDTNSSYLYTIYIKMIEMLLKARISINAPDSKGVPPVFIAAEQGLKEVVRLILEYGKGNVDLDSYKTIDGNTARYYLKQIIPDLEPALHSKIEETRVNNTDRLLKYLLSLDQVKFVDEYQKLVDKNEHDLIVYAHNEKYTILQLATEKGLESAVDIILKYGAKQHETCPKNPEEPVAIACRNGYNNILEKFIENGTTLYKPTDGKSLLQIVIRAMKFGPKDRKSHYNECINTLLRNPKIQDPPITINHSDCNGNTALHYAARNCDQYTVLELLRKGASIGTKNKFKEPPVADIDPKTLKIYLDECVTDTCKRQSDSDYEIRFKYNFLVNPNIFLQEDTSKNSNSLMSPEMEALMYMTKNEKLWPLLKHPVISSFLHLKWQRISSLLVANFAFYCIFWLSLTIYIILGDVQNDNVNSLKALHIITYILACIGLIILILQEIFQILFSRKYYLYIKKIKNILEITLIIVTAFILFINTSEATNKQLSAVAILLSSAELILLIGHFPNLMTYFVMLRTVSSTFFKFFLWYCILIIAFALSFYVLFRKTINKDDQKLLNITDSVDNGFFEDPGSSLFKTLVMLTGEFDSSSIKFQIFPITSHVIFIAFIFMVPIVLFNLLSGLAVSDTQQIKANAEVFAHISTVQLISYIETIFIAKLYTHSRAWTYLPSCFKIFNLKTWFITPFAKTISLFPDFLPQYSIVIKPNRDNSIEIPRSPYQGRGNDCKDIESGKCIFIIGKPYQVHQKIVKEAKDLLYQKSQDSELDEIKSKLSQILQILESRQS